MSYPTEAAMLRTHVSAFALLLACTALIAGAEKLTPEEVLKQHLAQQLPGIEQRAGRERDVRGTCTVSTPSRGAGLLGGAFSLASGAESSRLMMTFQSDVYEGESFMFNANEVEVGFGQRRTTSRSAMGLFVSVNKVIVGEGLIGGVLNARWPLAMPGARQAKLNYDGMKKFDGRDAHRLRYRAKKGQNQLDVYLYLEPGTFRHVGSVYESSLAQSMGFTPESSSQRSETYYRLEETFSDFDQANGLTLPRTWVIRYARTGDSTSEWKYELKVQTVAEPATKPVN
jgi:hypothetical protein